MSYLTKQDIADIIDLKNTGWSQRKIAKKYGKSPGRISQILKDPINAIKREDGTEEKALKKAADTQEAIKREVDLRKTFCAAIAKSHLNPMVRKLQSNQNLTADEKRILREGARVYSQILSDMDKSKQLNLTLNQFMGDVTIINNKVKQGVRDEIAKIMSHLCPHCQDKLIELEDQGLI